MSASATSFVYDLSPPEDAAKRLWSELSTVHRIASRVCIMQDVVVLMVGGLLPVWGYGSRWRWWTGRTGPDGQWIYSCAYTINAGCAARLIASRYAELIAAQAVGAGRR